MTAKLFKRRPRKPQVAFFAVYHTKKPRIMRPGPWAQVSPIPIREKARLAARARALGQEKLQVPGIRLRIALHILWGMVGALLGRGWWLGAASPAAVALAAIGDSERVPTPTFALGVLLGCLTRISIPALAAPGPAVIAALSPALACTILWGIGHIAAQSGRRLNTTTRALLAGGAWSLCALLFGPNILYDRVVSLLGGVLAALLTVVGTRALRAIRSSRRGLTSEELASVALMAGLVVMGVADICVGAIMPARIIVMLLTLLVAYLGGGAAGAATGALLGAAMAMGAGGAGLTAPAATATAAMVGMMALSGLTAGMLRSLSRAGIAVGHGVGLLVCVLLTPTLGAVTPFFDWAAATLLFLSIPRSVLRALKQSADAMQAAAAEEGRAMTQVRRQTAAGVAGAARAAEGLAVATLKGSPQPIPLTVDRNRLIKACECVCEQCVWRVTCYVERPNETQDLHAKLADAVLLGEPWSVSAQIQRNCLRFAVLVIAMQSEQGVIKAEHRAAQERAESAACFAGQLRVLAKSLTETSQSLSEYCSPDPISAAQLRDCLNEAGVRFEDAQVVRQSGIPTVFLQLRPNARLTDEMRSAVSRAMGRPMDGPSEAEENGFIQLSPAPDLRFTTGIATASGSEQKRSGDCYDAALLANGRYISVLCDGMGTGPEAHSQAEATVSLLMELKRADIRPELMLEAANHVLMMRGSESFSTVDLCLIDPALRAAEVWRLGAAAGAILRDSKARPLCDEALPAGIVLEATPAVRRIAVMPDDVIVQVSDGVAGAEQCDWLCDLLNTLDARNPQQMAEAILEAALKKPDYQADDATVAVTRITRVGASGAQAREAIKEWMAGKEPLFARTTSRL